MNSTQLRIELPAELRAGIVEYKAALGSRLAALTARQTATARELAELREQEDALTSQVAMLQNTVRADDETGVANLTQLETRLRLVRGRIQAVEPSARAAQEDVVSLEACGLLKELRGFYAKELPVLIAEQLRPLFRDAHGARNLAHSTDAWTSLSGLLSYATWSGNGPATPQTVRQVFAILDRALAGRPAIYFDALEDEASTTPVETAAESI